MSLVLASTSPRRATLLREAGVAFTQDSPGIDDAAEAALLAACRVAGHDPAAVVRRLALAKLLAAAVRLPGQTILAADTICHLDGELLGKADDEAHARAILGRLRGRAHEVLTGVALLAGAGRLLADVVTSHVRFNRFDEATLEAFLATGLWAGKAGAYGIQDAESAPLIEGVTGSVANVKGLPIERVRSLLAEAGLPAGEAG
jgi:septum formation protein